MVVDWYWSWLLTAVGVTGLWMAGSGKWWGWGIGLGAQVLWLAYAVSTQQWGFVPACGVYGFMYFRNLRRWRARTAVS